MRDTPIVHHYFMSAVQDHPSELQALLHAAVDAVIFIDHLGMMCIFSPAAERMFGYRAEEAIGQNVTLLMDERDRAQHDAYLVRYRRTGVAHIIGVGREVQARRKDGSLFPALLSVGQVPGADPPEFVGFLQDLTLRRRAEQELRDARQRITQVSRLATLGEMASGISHELNQPLAAIANFAQAGTRLLALPEPDLPEISEALRQIAEQALRAGDIIHRFRSLARHRSLTLEADDLNEVIREIEPLTHADARASGVRLHLELAPELPRVALDRIQMQQVLLNLLRNSIDALQTVPRAERDVTIRTAGPLEGHVELTVADNGPGVPEQIRERLFMPFATTKEHGTGLGLVISRTIVEAHRGRLDYRSNRPHGARFIITLPMATDSSSKNQNR